MRRISRSAISAAPAAPVPAAEAEFGGASPRQGGAAQDARAARDAAPVTAGRPDPLDETVRLVPTGHGLPAPPPQGGSSRRQWLVAGGVGLLAMGGAAALLWPGSDPPPAPQRLGSRRLVPPLLRTTLRGVGVVFALARRSEQDETDPPDAPAPRERIELLAFAAEDLAPRFTVTLASVPRGGLPDAELLAEQGATIWLWLGGLGAVSAMDGQVLADTEGLAELNPDLADLIATAPRRAYRLADALVLEGGPPPRAWRIDPRDFRTSAATLPSPRPLPQINDAAAHGSGGPTAFRVIEARIGAEWLALPTDTAKLAAPLAARSEGRFLPDSAVPTGGGQQLWRGTVRLGSAAPPGWPANMQNRWGQAEQVTDLAVMPGLGRLALAGFLTAGTPAPLDVASPPGLLVLSGNAEGPLALIRLGLDGRPAWRATLPITRLRSVLPGPQALVLAGWAGPGAEAEDLLVAVGTDDGAVRSRPFSA